MVVDCANELDQRFADVYSDPTLIFKNAANNSKTGSMHGPKDFTEAYLASLEPNLAQGSTRIRKFEVKGRARERHVIDFVWGTMVQEEQAATARGDPAPHGGMSGLRPPENAAWFNQETGDVQRLPKGVIDNKLSAQYQVLVLSKTSLEVMTVRVNFTHGLQVGDNCIPDILPGSIVKNSSRSVKTCQN